MKDTDRAALDMLGACLIIALALFLVGCAPVAQLAIGCATERLVPGAGECSWVDFAGRTCVYQAMEGGGMVVACGPIP